jgi:hypothetical protein
MTKTELESKHIAELHALAAEAEVPRYRMLRREELIEKLSDGDGGSSQPKSSPSRAKTKERPSRPRRERGGRERRPRERGEGSSREEGSSEKERPAREERPPRAERSRREKPPKPASEPESTAAATPTPAETSAPKRKRRRRRFGRRSKGLRVSDLLTPPPGRQSLVYGEGRVSCTALLREIAAELGEGSIALLIDPSPEELADWKRGAPEAELVVAASPRHASDALAQARRRAEEGEDVTLLVDSLTRLEDTDTAKAIFDGGLGLASSGSLTVVAALERSS